MSGKLIFVTGGIRSGKSAFAEEITFRLGEKVTYLATAQVLDEEMRFRIEQHRERRPDSWITLEEPINVTEAIIKQGKKCEVIMLDCLTIFISNLMIYEEQRIGKVTQKEMRNGILGEISNLAKAAKKAAAHVVIVSNEVGLTLVSDNYLGRMYQELVGAANQIVAGLADEAYLVVAGHPIDLKKGFI